MIVLLIISAILGGLISGYFITRFSIDEVKGKQRILLYLIAPFIILFIFFLDNLISPLLLFIIAHLCGSILYLRRIKA